MAEWDFRTADTHLVTGYDSTATTMVFAHSSGYPELTIWATLAPDDPREREEIIITARSGASMTVKRGFSYTPAIAHKPGTIVRIGTRSGAYPEDWNAVSSFQNSWSNFGGGFATAAYRRYPDGLVQLRGFITGGTVGSAAFTLPTAYRPADATRAFATVGGGSVFARVDVQTSGAVIPVAVGSGRCSLDGVIYHGNA